MLECPLCGTAMLLERDYHGPRNWSRGYYWSCQACGYELDVDPRKWEYYDYDR